MYDKKSPESSLCDTNVWINLTSYDKCFSGNINLAKSQCEL